jgi:hypothetical protein
MRGHNVGWKIAYRMWPVLSSCGIRKQINGERRPNACVSGVTDSYIHFGKCRRRKDYVGRWNVSSNIGKLPHLQVICADNHLWTNGPCSPNLFCGQNSYFPHTLRWKRCSGFEKPPVSDGIPLSIPSLVMWFNHLNAELNLICNLLVLLGDLTFMGPCIISIFQYTRISNKTQRYTVYLHVETALRVSGKHVEQFPHVNKLCNVASCWIYEYIRILLGAHHILHISRIRVILARVFVIATDLRHGRSYIFSNTVLWARMLRRTPFVQRLLPILGSLCSEALHNLNRTAARNVR